MGTRHKCHSCYVRIRAHWDHSVTRPCERGRFHGTRSLLGTKAPSPPLPISQDDEVPGCKLQAWIRGNQGWKNSSNKINIHSHCTRWLPAASGSLVLCLSPLSSGGCWRRWTLSASSRRHPPGTSLERATHRTPPVWKVGVGPLKQSRKQGSRSLPVAMLKCPDRNLGCSVSLRGSPDRNLKQLVTPTAKSRA